ncbi:hypothetical protein VTJ49DRAFT_777 [Mycothermus thermophilus]|uniref:Major facilitator superfamily (MFS) profile domain-containing protein n=1 Tax=Humicola insolens TaxID=85995 RepID=A0ABR3VG82_HUMIN
MQGQSSTRQGHPDLNHDQETRRHVDRNDTSRPKAAPFLVAVAKLAAFSDVFLSGLIIPVIPILLESRAQVPRAQVQVWTSVLVAAHGGAFAVLSPLMPLLTRQGSTACIVLIAGLAATAAAFALLHFSADHWLWILARVIHGFAAAAVIAASSGILATANTNGLSCLSPAFLQNAAMATSPFVAGALHNNYGAPPLFYSAYALIALNLVLGLIAARVAPSGPATGTREETAALLDPESSPSGYGTLSSHTSQSGERSPRSLSPTSPDPRSTQRVNSAGTIHFGPRLSVAWGGYLVLALLASSLYSVLPVFSLRHFHWSILSSASLFLPLSAPAAITGLFLGAVASRVPKSVRFLVTIGFLATIPAFLALGRMTEETETVYCTISLSLGIISLAAGLSGDPLLREITAATASSADQSWSATAHVATLPYSANAWGTLIGPFFAGAISWLWCWKTMTQSLAVVAGGAGVLSLLFLQGWIGHPCPDTSANHSNARSLDEESAPLLAHSRSAFVTSPETFPGKPETYHAQRRDSEEVSPHTRSKSRPRRRHFSVDNFSIATTAAGSVDSSGSSVRFQAALETPVPPPSNTGRRRSQASDITSRTTSAERRYVMREAPHAPATDPLLAAGSLYVIDEERDTAAGVETARQKRRVVVFPEGAAPPELLAKHRHHVVAINALDGTAQMVADATHNHAVHVTEETDESAAFEDDHSRRYVVIVVEGDEVNAE